jgi:4-amino-4-deoxy-L-arabinose transferase-like glycosyltransferase
MQMRKENFLPHFDVVTFLVILAGICLYGTWNLGQATHYGFGLVNDSAAYVGGASSLLEGRGFYRTAGGGELKPIVHFAPLYSVLLAGAAALGGPILNAAAGSGCLLYGAVIALAGLLTRYLTHSNWAGWLAAVFVAGSDIPLQVFAYVLSEPLALALLLLTGWAFGAYYLRRQKRWMLLAGVGLGLSYLTRYAAVSLLAAAALTILLVDWPHGAPSFRRKNIPLRELLLLGAGSLPLMILWAVRNLLVSGTTNNRVLAWHPLAPQKMVETLKNLLTWLAPDAALRVFAPLGYLFSAVSVLVVPALLAGLAWQIIRSRRAPRQALETDPRRAIITLLAVFVPVYILFLFVSISLFDASTPLDTRLLSPVTIAEIILTGWGLAWAWRRLAAGRPAVQAGILLLAAALAAGQIIDGRAAAAQMARDGLGFANRYTLGSATFQMVRDLPGSLIVYSNRPTILFLLAGRNAYVTPTSVDSATGQARPDYAASLAEMKQAVQSGRAVLVFYEPSGQVSPEDQSDYQTLTEGLKLAQKTSDAEFYRAGP